MNFSLIKDRKLINLLGNRIEIGFKQQRVYLNVEQLNRSGLIGSVVSKSMKVNRTTKNINCEFNVFIKKKSICIYMYRFDCDF